MERPQPRPKDFRYIGPVGPIGRIRRILARGRLLALPGAGHADTSAKTRAYVHINTHVYAHAHGYSDSVSRVPGVSGLCGAWDNRRRGARGRGGPNGDRRSGEGRGRGSSVADPG